MNNFKYTVLITDLIIDEAKIEKDILGDDFNVIVANAKVENDISNELLNKCDAVIAYDALKFDKKMLSRMKNCKIISRAGIGYDNIDLIQAQNNKITVCNVPDYCMSDVADQTIAMILSFSRGIPSGAESIKEGTWERMSPTAFRLSSKTLGIFGLGRIGSVVALKAKALGLNVIFYDPYVRVGHEKILDIKRVDTLEDFAALSDIVSIHSPLTSETNGIINNKFFNNMKINSMIINTARGPIINIEDLYVAMKSGKILASGLDVVPIEPIDKSHNLIKDFIERSDWIKGRLIVTPHSAFYSPESLIELRTKSALNIKDFINNKSLRNKIV